MPRPRAAPLALLALAACGAGVGRVQIFITAEDTIPEGLSPGTDEDQVVDGWSVEYSAFLVAIGGLRAGRSADPGDALADDDVHVVDLLELPPGGLVLAEWDDVPALRWDRFGYDIPDAGPAAVAAAGVDADELARMVEGGLSLHVAGVLRKPDGQSCAAGDPDDCAPAPEIRFAWSLSVGTSFDDCTAEFGDAGFAVPLGGTAAIKPTIHGDHWFFTNITQGAELTDRRAQWIADCDLDRDGEVTLDELKRVPAARLFRAELGYNVSGALGPIVSAHDFLRAQARTLGDFQGEGECPTREPL